MGEEQGMPPGGRESPGPVRRDPEASAADGSAPPALEPHPAPALPAEPPGAPLPDTARAPGPAAGEPSDRETGGWATGTVSGCEPPAADPPAVEDPVEILVTLAERGEIDPWNINIIEVTDRFLNELERRRQLNLQLSGRTLFYAATLLRMKSEYLADTAGEGDDGGADGFGEEFDEEPDPDFGYEGRLGPIELLEREIQRRLDRKNLRKSPVTLFELIVELKNIEKEERRRRRLADAEPLLPDADDVVSIAHDEGYQDSAVSVYQECLRCMACGREMTLAELCRNLGWDLPSVYIPLLFLMLDGQCALRQEEFFGDVFVQVCKAGDLIEKTLLEGG